MSLSDRTNTELEKDRTLNAVDLLADDILGVDVLRAVAVPTPEYKFGSQAFVAELSAEERDQLEVGWAAYQEAQIESEDNVGFRAYCVAFCLCDQKRGLLFRSDEEVVAAANKLRKRNAKATSRLFNTISRINGLTKADIDALEGNSEATRQENAAGSGESHSD